MSRTTAQIGERLLSGEDCSNCGMSYRKCTGKVLSRHFACCGACGYSGTHDEKPVPGDIPSPVPEPLAGRLFNWKFDSAVQRLDEGGWTGPRADLVRALGALYGNSGWFEGAAGDLVSASLRVMGVDDED